MKRFLISIFILFFLGFVNDALSQTCPPQTQYSFNWATLVGEITNTGGDNNLQVWFEWGPTNALGNSTPLQNINVTFLPYRFCYTLTNLNQCTTYFYRAAVRNQQNINFGQIYSFRTKCQSETSLAISCTVSPNPANTNSLVTFMASVSGGTGNYFYNWSGACNSNSSICQNSFSNPGTYSSILTVTSGSQTRSTTCSVNIVEGSGQIQPLSNQPPVPLIAFRPANITPNTLVTFDARQSYDPDGNIISYFWYFNDQFVSNNISFQRVLPSGTHRIKLEVQDNRGVKSSKEILISVGRNIYQTRTVYISNQKPSSPQLSTNAIQLELGPSYQVKKCQSNQIQFSLTNNSSVKRKIDLSVSGEISHWFEPEEKSLTLQPDSTKSSIWTLNVPCDLDIKKAYNFKIKASTNGYTLSETSLLNISQEENRYFLGLIALPKISLWFFIIFLIFIIIINYLIWHFIFKVKKYEQ